MSQTTLNSLGIISRSTINDKFKYDPSTTTGLTFGYKGGTIAIGANPITIANGTVALTDNATNYVELTAAGTVHAHTDSGVEILLYKVVTSGGAITSITDLRSTYH